MNSKERHNKYKNEIKDVSKQKKVFSMILYFSFVLVFVLSIILITNKDTFVEGIILAIIFGTLSLMPIKYLFKRQKK